MSHHTSFTGQKVDGRAHNDNAPAKYSAPSQSFKNALAGYANPFCSRCGGTGYIGRFKGVCAGRCFKCIPDRVWEQMQGMFDRDSEAKTACDEMTEIYVAVCGRDGCSSAYLSDGMWITSDGQLHDSAHTRGPNYIAAFPSACLPA